MKTDEPESTPLQVAGVVTFYLVAALVMVFVNKAVLNEAPDLPFTFLLLQSFIAVLLLRLLALLSRTSARAVLPVEFELPMFSRETLMDILPFSTVGLTGLVFNTFCLANVDTAFFQIARGLLLPSTIVVSSVYTRTKPQLKVLVAAFIVTCGFLVGTAPTFTRKATSNLSRDSAIALFYGCMSSFVLSLHAVLKKSALSRVGHSVLSLSYLGNLFMTVVLLPCALLHGELGILQRRFQAVDQDWTTFVVGTLVTGLFGFLLGLANSLSIKVTSPVTHMFSSAAKGVIQTVLGIAIFGDIITPLRGYSITIITGGTIYYTWAQTQTKPQVRFPKADVEKQADNTEISSQSQERRRAKSIA
ncbi:hypothetical protein DFH07DRAFT_898611 [Mycena maculata]|uniref:Sugar phosphate transporter domain-containing protein n=1 Tax=Mycena maculata TaxID=230809 RepID=A0AAD7HHN0_9AGAR|nr:hypothetical protein DFH07DRAFT_898611 [Mycena maculata]